MLRHLDVPSCGDGVISHFPMPQHAMKKGLIVQHNAQTTLGAWFLSSPGTLDLLQIAYY